MSYNFLPLGIVATTTALPMGVSTDVGNTPGKSRKVLGPIPHVPKYANERQTSERICASVLFVRVPSALKYKLCKFGLSKT